jgi:hypothetical protein
MDMDNLPAIRVLLEHDGTAVDGIAIDQMKGRRFIYGGLSRPDRFLILANTPSHAFSKASGESIRLIFGEAG